MSDNEAPQILVNANPLIDQMAGLGRSVALVLGALSTIAGIASQHDLHALIAYIQTSDFATAAAIVVTAGSLGWGWWKTGHRAKQLIAVAADPRVPDSVVAIKPTSTPTEGS